MRAPVFIFRNARDGRDFTQWLRDNFDTIKAKAESTTSVGKLLEIEIYPSHAMVFTRFDYSTGDANQCSVCSDVTTAGDLYCSITLPALIMATFGGTSLATQRECLELMDCYGTGKVYKLLEIAADLVVAGELSLVAATRTDKKTGKNEWVDAHEKLGRNR